jgi:hypothetical protein
MLLMTSEVDRMKTVKFDAKAETAWGKAIDPVPYSGSYQAFETIDEIRNVGEFPSDKDIINFVNANRKASARSKALVEALKAAGHEQPTLENNVLMQLKQLYKVYIAAKKSDEEARMLAATTLGVEWPTDEA